MFNFTDYTQSNMVSNQHALLIVQRGIKICGHSAAGEGRKNFGGIRTEIHIGIISDKLGWRTKSDVGVRL